MILAYKANWILIIISFLIGIFAHQKGKNPLLLGLIAYFLGLAIVGIIIFIDPFWNFWFVRLGLSEESLYSFGAFSSGGFIYSYLKNSVPRKEDNKNQ